MYNLSNAEPIYPLINNAVSDENVNAFLTAIEEPKEETSLDTEEQPLRETAPSTGPQQLETTDINPCKLEPGKKSQLCSENSLKSSHIPDQEPEERNPGLLDSGSTLK